MPMSNRYPALAALAHRQGGPFTTAQARAAGYDLDEVYRKLRSGEWVKLRRGVYVDHEFVPPEAGDRHRLQFRAVQLCLKAPACASHVTGAVVHRLALLDPDLSRVHVTRNGTSSARAEADVRHHAAALPEQHVITVDGMPATSVARTVVDFARVSAFDAGLVAAESALNQKLTTLADLRDVLTSCVDWPGAREAARVVSFASEFSESPGESLGRIAFEALGLPQPAQQVLLYDDRGLIGRGDYFWEEYRTVGEFDGRLKYSGPDAEEVLYKEKLREDRIREAGIEVFRFGFTEARTCSPSIRRKARAAFARAAASARPAVLRFELQTPAA